MSEELPRVIGPYELVESIGQGGMAEVFRARRDGPGGFVKDLALKQILPQYSKNKQLVQRFMEEARIAGALTHGNVVSVYDFGYVEGEYFIAMEYIDGMSLATILDRCTEMGISLPSPIVAYIGAEVCSGLAYAHHLNDISGKKIKVVHRDVSPQNIMLSYAGDVKIGDFGIVKAADSLIRTEAGLRVGKTGYMSPEQAAGEPLDGRSDIFALGVTLWEALTLRPLLPRGNAPKTIQILSKCHFPPPMKYRRDVPPELERIVMEALSLNKDSRPADGEVMARALRIFLHSVAPGFGRHDLVEYLEWLQLDPDRPSGYGPPVAPPVPMSSLRGAKTAQRAQRDRLLTLTALILAPFVGLVFGVGAFFMVSSLFSKSFDEDPQQTQQIIQDVNPAPPPVYYPQAPQQPPGQAPPNGHNVPVFPNGTQMPTPHPPVQVIPPQQFPQQGQIPGQSQQNLPQTPQLLPPAVIEGQNQKRERPRRVQREKGRSQKQIRGRQLPGTFGDLGERPKPPGEN